MDIIEGSARPKIKIVKRKQSSEGQPPITEPTESVETKMTAKDHVKASQEVLNQRKQADAEFLENWRRVA